MRARVRLGRLAGVRGRATRTVTFSYFGERTVACDITVFSDRTVEGEGSGRRTHFTVQTAIASTSDPDCFTIVADLAANLTYRRASDAEPETITMHSFGDSATVLLDTTLNGVVTDARSDHVASFDCSDTHACEFHFATSPK